MNKEQHITEIIQKLRNPETIRSQAQRILELGKQNKLKHFTVHPEKMDSTADYVLEVITCRYPDLNVPYHSRWRHFEMDGLDRIKTMLEHINPSTAAETGKILYELVILSVFLDAGAGKSWTFKEAETGKIYSRSEGLALASLAMYRSGVFSADPQNPYRVDAQRLLDFKAQDLQEGFQVSDDNPLEGVAGRTALLNSLGRVIRHKPHYFGKDGRLGDIYSYVCTLSSLDNCSSESTRPTFRGLSAESIDPVDKPRGVGTELNSQRSSCISATSLFQTVLNAFEPVWPERLTLQGVPLGDVWIHSALKTSEPAAEYVPFHKLSQWLTYSLIEPLEQSGIKVTDLDALTGLPEYRNGGLLIDCGLLSPKDEQVFSLAQDPGSELIIEWRALTVALLDELAALIRKKLKLTASELPLAKILQGGTWEAGRKIAKELRPSGTPPIQIISDGTIF